MKTNKMKNLARILSVLVLMMWVSVLWAQTRTITGTVIDTKGEAVIGASVVVKGTTIGTVTDVKGNFSLNVPVSAKTLIISFIGMTTKDVPITGNHLNVTLQDNSVELNEVVAIGYGSVRKSDLTGAVSSVNASTVADAGRTSVLNTLQGAIPGVQIQQTSSQVGSNFNVVIRGQNSISGSTTPLYVVDGVITPNIDFLNPQEIQKIDILKDASSTAIYGSRGANGVVIIQTKSGANLAKTSHVSISYDGYYGLVNKARMPDFMNSQQFMQYRTITYQTTSPDANGDGGTTFNKSNLGGVWVGAQTLNSAGQPLYPDGVFSGSQWLLNRYLNNQSTNWADLVTHTGQQQNHYIGISGSSNDVSYVVGMGYQNQGSIFVNDDYQQYNLNGSVHVQLNKQWSAGFNLQTAYSDLQTGSNNSMVDAFRMSPIVVPYSNGNLDPTQNALIGNIIVIPGKTTETTKNADGYYIYPNSIGTGGFTSSVNPLIDLTSTSNDTRTFTALGNIYLQYEPIEHLTVKTTFEPQIITYRAGFYESSLADANYNKPPIANVENNQNFTYTWDNQVNYKIPFKNTQHALDVMGLYSIYAGNIEDYQINTSGYNYDYNWYNLGAATSTSAGTTKVSSSYQGFSMMSVAFRANYSFKDRYLLTATYRTDGSSKLAPGKKWAAFPSVALGWRIMEESFMKRTQNWLSNLKLRASLGYTGNNNINPYQTQTLANVTTYYNFGSTLAQGVAAGAPASTVLTWEKTRELDFGLDYGFFNNRLNGTIDLYDRRSTGLLESVTLPLESGAGSMIENLGSISNRGAEISLNAAIINTSDLSWSVYGNFATNKNKILNLFGNTTPGYTYINSNTQKWIVGQDINSIYGYVFDGVWTADGIKAAIAAKDPRVVNASGTVIACEGQAKVKDFNGNGIDPSDRRVQGHSDPTWTSGFGTNVTFKGFDFAVNFYVAQGMTVFSPFMEEFTNFKDRGREKLNVDYYVPAGASIIGPDGLFTTTTVSHNSQTYPMPNNYGPYWHTSSETANDMPGSWVNASYVKVQNMTLGYSIPKKILNGLGIHQLRVYCNVLNPFIFTKYKGFDPEWAGASMNKNNGPSTIVYQMGVNFKF